MSTSTTTTLHIQPENGAWSIKRDEAAEPASVHLTRAQALARAYEMLEDQDGFEVQIHGEDGRVRSTVTIRQVEDQDAAVRAEALRITPSTERLKAIIARKLPVEGADLEANPADLY